MLSRILKKVPKKNITSKFRGIKTSSKSFGFGSDKYDEYDKLDYYKKITNENSWVKSVSKINMSNDLGEISRKCTKISEEIKNIQKIIQTNDELKKTKSCGIVFRGCSTDIEFGEVVELRTVKSTIDTLQLVSKKESDLLYE